MERFSCVRPISNKVTMLFLSRILKSCASILLTKKIISYILPNMSPYVDCIYHSDSRSRDFPYHFLQFDQNMKNSLYFSFHFELP